MKISCSIDNMHQRIYLRLLQFKGRFSIDITEFKYRLYPCEKYFIVRIWSEIGVLA